MKNIKLFDQTKIQEMFFTDSYFLTHILKCSLQRSLVIKKKRRTNSISELLDKKNPSIKGPTKYHKSNVLISKVLLPGICNCCINV